MFTLTIALGCAVSLVFLETVALSAGGIIAPGYVALILDRPRALVGFALIVAATYAVMRLLADALFLYGVRRFGMTVLIGLVFATGAQALPLDADLAVLEWAGLGYIVPGLIAHQCDRQGVVPTLLMLAIAAPITRLLALATMRVLT